jgi:hypothetical protein
MCDSHFLINAKCCIFVSFTVKVVRTCANVWLWLWWSQKQTRNGVPMEGYKIVQAPQNGFVATTLLGFHYVWPCPEVWTHRIIDPKLSDPWYPWNKIHGIHGLQLSFTMFHLNGPVGSPTGPNPWRLFLRCGPSTFSMLGERWQSRSSVFVHSWSGSNVG